MRHIAELALIHGGLNEHVLCHWGIWTLGPSGGPRRRCSLAVERSGKGGSPSEHLALPFSSALSFPALSPHPRHGGLSSLWTISQNKPFCLLIPSVHSPSCWLQWADTRRLPTAVPVHWEAGTVSPAVYSSPQRYDSESPSQCSLLKYSVLRCLLDSWL